MHTVPPNIQLGGMMPVKETLGTLDVGLHLGSMSGSELSYSIFPKAHAYTLPQMDRGPSPWVNLASTS